MNVLVTGITGRVGRNVSRALILRGHKVKGLVLSGDPGVSAVTAAGLECTIGNLREPDIAAAAVSDIDAVIHLGAMMLYGSSLHNATLFEDNLRGTFNLAHAAAMRKVRRFIFASSDEAYPSMYSRYLPIDENHPTQPYSFYGLTKLAGEEVLRYYHRANALPISIARFALVMEPWEATHINGTLGGFLFLKSMLPMIEARAGVEAASALRAQLKDDNTLLLARDSDGIPYMFHCADVRDIVQGLLLMLDVPSAVGEAFNLSGPAPFVYDQVIPYLAQKSGYPFIDARIAGPSIRIHHSTAKARQLLGYDPQFNIFQSITDGFSDSRA